MPVSNGQHVTTTNSLQEVFAKETHDKTLSNGDIITLKILTTLDLITVKKLSENIEDEMTQDMLLAGMSLVKVKKANGQLYEYPKVNDLEALLQRVDVPLGIWTEIVEFSGSINGLKDNVEQAKK